MVKEVDMLCKFDKNGALTPIRFRVLDENEEERVIAIDRIHSRDISRFAGNKTYIYRCEVTLQKMVRTIELRYFVDECRWLLMKVSG